MRIVDRGTSRVVKIERPRELMWMGDHCTGFGPTTPGIWFARKLCRHLPVELTKLVGPCGVKPIP